MYTKEEILAEIKRVAEKLGVKVLKREDFEKNTTIPNDTISFYLGSWDRALKEAGLGPETPAEIKGKREPQNEDELLVDLVRLFEETGETPTAALVNSRGRYHYRHYGARWKSLGEALKLAVKKFPPKSRTFSTLSPSPPPPSPPSGSDSGDFNKKLFSGLSDFSELGIYQADFEEIGSETGEMEKNPSIREIAVASEGEREVEAAEELFRDDGVADKMTGTPKIKQVPQTIKPKIAKKKPKLVGGPINFRGLKFAPVNAKGVAYLFGMIGAEMGFVLETFRTAPPDVEGKRCIDTANDLWKKVKIDFVYKSSDFNSPGHNEMETDIITCWVHDWEDCPVEVLELRSAIQLLDGAGPF